MSRTPETDQRQQLRGNLDQLAGRADKVLKKRFLGMQAKTLASRTLKLIFLFPMLLLLAELLRFAMGGESWGLNFWQYLLLSSLLAVASLLGGLVWTFAKLSISRAKSLALVDRQLGSANSLVTADEFLAQESQSSFMAAAIEEAVAPVKKALDVELDPVTDRNGWQLSRWSLLSVPAAVLMSFVAVWLGGMQLANAGAQDQGAALAGLDGAGQNVVVGEVGSGSHSPAAEQNSSEASGEGDASEQADLQGTGSDGSSSSKGTVPEDGGESMPTGGNTSQAGQQSGGMPTGSSSQPQSQSSSAQQKAGAQEGAETAQATAEKDKTEQADGKKGSQEAQQSASGQGSSGSSGSTGEQGSQGAASESDSGQQSGDESDQGDSEAESSGDQNSGNESGGEQGDGGDNKEQGGEQGEGEQGEKQAGGEASDSGEAEKEGEAQAAGGEPGGSGDDGGQGESDGAGSASEDEIKKNRGVPSAILGLPQYERLKGKMGPGPDQKMQQQSEPSEQAAAKLAAEQRQARSEMIGELPKSRISGWSRNLVKNYFLELRQKSN